MKELRLVALTRGHGMKCLLRRMLDRNEFLCDNGVRSLSKFHQAHRYSITIRGEEKAVSFPKASPTPVQLAPLTRYMFNEYFHGVIGAGLGASHQTGWTGLVAKLIQQQGEFGTII